MISEFFAAAGVFLGLMFVGWEIRQNTIAARASAYQALGISISTAWFAIAEDVRLNNLIHRLAAGGDQTWLRDLPDEERQRVASLWIGMLRQYETVHRQIEQGLLRPEALQAFGLDTDADLGSLAVVWPEVKRWMSPSFVPLVEGRFGTSEREKPLSNPSNAPSAS